MNILPDFSSTIRAIPKPESPSSGCDLDCKEKLFHALADRSRLCILHSLCQGAQTVEQIAAATGLSQVDVLNQIERLLDCGCVTLKRTAHSLRYTLSAPRFLQLEAVADEFLVASFKGGRRGRSKITTKNAIKRVCALKTCKTGGVTPDVGDEPNLKGHRSIGSSDNNEPK